MAITRASPARAWGGSYGQFSYANANYDLLGRIVESVSGESYASYLRANIFDVAGMDDASVDRAEDPRAAATPAHRDWFGIPVVDGFSHGEDDDEWGGQASGYVRASIRDMASYLRLYLNNGGRCCKLGRREPYGVGSRAGPWRRHVLRHGLDHVRG